MKRKILAILTTIALLLSVVPVNVFAETAVREEPTGPSGLMPAVYSDDARYGDNLYSYRKVQPGDDVPQFQDVEMTVKDNVWLVSDGVEPLLKNVKLEKEVTEGASYALLPLERLAMGGLVDDEIIKDTIGEVPSGDVIFDANTGVAVKVGANDQVIDGQVYSKITLPEAYEVLEDFNIPKQTVSLNENNIYAYGDHVKEAQNTTRGNRLSTSDFTSFSFDESMLVGSTEDGTAVNVKVSGDLNFGSMDVDGDYSWNGGYDFEISYTESVHLEAEVAAQIHEEVTVFLFGVDIPAGVASVSGAVYLIVGIDGEFTIRTELDQRFSAYASVHGGTFWGIPTSIHTDAGADASFDVDVNVSGEVFGYVKIGPRLKLELLGWEALGASAYLGARFEGSVQNRVISMAVYGTMEARAKFLWKSWTIMNEKRKLFEFTQPDMQGYEVRFLDVCAYRDVVWARILKDKQIEGGYEAFVGPVTLEFLRPTTGQTRSFTVNTEADGIFELADMNWDLQKDDRVYIKAIGDNDSLGEVYVEPTFPFSHSTLEYADFFNDQAKGGVSGAYYHDWHTEKAYYMEYEGGITLDVVDEMGISVGSTTGSTDETGNYLIPYDFKPNQMVTAKITDDGFTYEGSPRETDEDLFGVSVNKQFENFVDETGETVIEGYGEYEVFFIINPRGDKRVDQVGLIETEFHEFTGINGMYDPFTGRRYLADPVGTSSENLYFTPYYGSDMNTYTGGTSMVYSGYKMTWEWNKPETEEDNEPDDGGLDTQLGPIDTTPLDPKPIDTSDEGEEEDGGILGPIDTTPDIDLGDLEPIDPDKIDVDTLEPIDLTPIDPKPIDPIDPVDPLDIPTLETPDLELKPLTLPDIFINPSLIQSEDIVVEDISAPTIMKKTSTETDIDYSVYPLDEQGVSLFSYDDTPRVFNHVQEAIYHDPIYGIHYDIRDLARMTTYSFEYEGVQIVVEDINETGGGNPSGVPVVEVDDPVRNVLIDVIDSRINPPTVMEIAYGQEVMLPSWSAVAAEEMISNNIMETTVTGNFPTGQTMTRGDVAASLARAFNLPISSNLKAFSDVPAMHPYTGEIAAAYAAGMIKGSGDGSFNPFGSITRQEVAVMVSRALATEGIEGAGTADLGALYKDWQSIDGWASGSVANIYELGLMVGANGSFNPKGNITFDEMAVLTQRLMALEY